MNHLETIALARAAEKLAAAADKPETGLHLVDFEIHARVVGTMTKDADGTYQPSLAFPLQPTLALALQLAGVARDRAKAVAESALAAALCLAQGEQDQELKDRLDDIAAAQAHVEATAAKPEPRPRAGALRASLQFKDLAAAEVPAAKPARKPRKKAA